MTLTSAARTAIKKLTTDATSLTPSDVETLAVLDPWLARRAVAAWRRALELRAKGELRQQKRRALSLTHPTARNQRSMEVDSEWRECDREYRRRR